MIAFKGFDKGLVCLGYKFEPYVKNVTKEAKCFRNGFHAAEDPLDVFKYYPNTETSEYWMVQLSGDMHESGDDSKIAATELIPVRRLSLKEMTAFGLIYRKKHPGRSKCGKNSYAGGKIKIARGKNPVLCGAKGDILGFAVDCKGKIQKINVIVIDGRKYKPDVKYNADGKAVYEIERISVNA